MNTVVVIIGVVVLGFIIYKSFISKKKKTSNGTGVGSSDTKDTGSNTELEDAGNRE